MAKSSQGREMIVGVVGLKAAGKDVLCQQLARFGFDVQSTSSAVLSECVRQGIAYPTVAQMQDVADRVKREQGDFGLWARRAITAARRAGSMLIAVNCLRHPAEVEVIRDQGGSLTMLIGITAPTRVRAERLIARARPGDPQTVEEFLDLDDRDRGIGEPPNGQQVDRTLGMVTPGCIYCNDGTLAEYREWVSELLHWFPETAI